MKREARILGIDDSPFQRSDSRVLVVGTIFRGPEFLDGILSTTVERDGTDSTERIANMVLSSKFYSQLRIIMTDGINLGGFNIIDLQELHGKTKIPVIAVMRTLPDIDKIKSTLYSLGMERKSELIDKAGRIYKGGKVFFQAKGIDEAFAREIIQKMTVHAGIPEPIRIAHIIGSGIIQGESRGRA